MSDDERRASDEIEITPEMIELGLDEWAIFDESFEPREWALCRIYRAMATGKISALVHDKLAPRESTRGE